MAKEIGQKNGGDAAEQKVNTSRGNEEKPLADEYASADSLIIRNDRLSNENKEKV